MALPKPQWPASAASPPAALSLCLKHLVHLDCPAVNLPAWAGWLYWINPLSYALRALVLNEFEAPRWHKPSPYDPARSLGTFILDTFDFNHAHW